MAYAKRYAAGFVDKPTLTTPIDSQFLNAVETALLELLTSDGSVDGQVMQWINASSRFGPALLLNKNIDPAAAIDKSKLNLAGQIVNADVSGAAAIDRSKLNFGAGLVNADISAVAALAISKLAGYPANGSLALRGDGTWAAVPKITTSTWAGGPPGAPSDGDIWIATAVDAIGTRWQFQYNAGSASTYKWEFIGGTPIRALGGAVTAALSAWTTAVAWTAGRGGDYEVISAWLQGKNNAATTQEVDIGVSSAGGAPAGFIGAQFPADVLNHEVVGDGFIASVVAGATVTLMVDPATLQLNVQQSAMRIVPRRII